MWHSCDGIPVSGPAARGSLGPALPRGDPTRGQRQSPGCTWTPMKFRPPCSGDGHRGLVPLRCGRRPAVPECRIHSRLGQAVEAESLPSTLSDDDAGATLTSRSQDLQWLTEMQHHQSRPLGYKFHAVATPVCNLFCPWPCAACSQRFEIQRLGRVSPHGMQATRTSQVPRHLTLQLQARTIRTGITNAQTMSGPTGPLLPADFEEAMVWANAAEDMTPPACCKGATRKATLLAHLSQTTEWRIHAAHARRATVWQMRQWLENIPRQQESQCHSCQRRMTTWKPTDWAFCFRCLTLYYHPGDPQWRCPASTYED